MIEEIETQTYLFYTGKFKKEVGGTYSVSDFSVWVEIAESDIDITAKLTVDQLQVAKFECLELYEAQTQEEKSFYISEREDGHKEWAAEMNFEGVS